MIQEILALVVEVVLSDHAEILFGNMDKEFLQQFSSEFFYRNNYLFGYISKMVNIF